MTVYILGAGPTGLALVDGLIEDTDLDFTMIERGPSIGGLAQSLTWENHGKHDLGPHKIFTLNAELLQRVKNLIPAEDWLVRPKKSKIFMNGHFLPYPPSPFSLLGVYGVFSFIRMVMDYGLALVKALLPHSPPKTFEDDLSRRVGNTLYTVLFKPIAFKLWGDPKNLDLKLSKGRVQTPSLSEVLAGVLRLKKKSNFEALEFIYPKGGLQRLWNSIYRKSERKGRWLLDTEITGLVANGDYISEIHCRNRKDGTESVMKVTEQDMVFSTLPIGMLPRLMTGIIAKDTVKLIDQVIQLNDLILVFLKIDRPKLIDESWIFVPDPTIAFHRISEQKSFDPEMTPNGSIVCCEIMSNETRAMSTKSNEELIQLVIDGLVHMGLDGFKILAQKVIRLPKSYPVFRPNFESGLAQALAQLDKLANFRTIGRQGAFNYIGTLDCMDIGYGAAEWYLRKLAKDECDWLSERQRTSFYPVLD